MPSEHNYHLKMVDDQFTAIPPRSLSEICLHLPVRHPKAYAPSPVCQIPFISNSAYLIRELFVVAAKAQHLAVHVSDQVLYYSSCMIKESGYVCNSSYIIVAAKSVHLAYCPTFPELHI